MNVSSIAKSAAEYGFNRPLNALSKTKAVKWVCKNYQDNNLAIIAGLGVFSIVMKDGMGCYMYVKQSLNNKEIPEDKRKFVAALDLANGGLMIATQLLTFFTLSNKTVQTKLFDKFFGKIFSRSSRKALKTKLDLSGKLYNANGREFNSMFKGFKEKTSGTFGILSALVASTIIAKRVIVPFIATPLAEKAKKLLYKDEAQKKENTPNKIDKKV